jgi:hypothetical protein
MEFLGLVVERSSCPELRGRELTGGVGHLCFGGRENDRKRRDQDQETNRHGRFQRAPPLQ